MSDSEPEYQPKLKKKATPAQLAGLQKGMETLKLKREALAVQRDEHEKKKASGQIPAETPAPQFIPKQKTKVMAPRPEPILVMAEKKPKVFKPKVMTDDLKGELAEMKASLSALKKPAEIKTQIVEKIVEKHVDRVVERIVSGSALLDAVFKFK